METPCGSQAQHGRQTQNDQPQQQQQQHHHQHRSSHTLDGSGGEPAGGGDSSSHNGSTNNNNNNSSSSSSSSSSDGRHDTEMLPHRRRQPGSQRVKAGQRLRVGCLLTAKKQKHLGFPRIAEHAASRGVDMVIVDLRKPLDLQGPFDILLHKLTDIMCNEDASTKAQLSAFEAYVRSHPHIVVVDPLASVEALLDRSITADVMRACEIPRHHGPSVCHPDTVVVREGLQPCDVDAAAAVQFPAIVKNISAHSTAVAHKMSLLFSSGSLADVASPCIVQQFINHGGILHKIFVIGDAWYTELRPSIRNLTHDAQGKTIFFDSHEVSKPDSDSDLNEKGALSSRPSLDAVLVEDLVKALRHRLNLSLFGIDIVVQAETGNLYVIDINYFPGYAGVPDLPDVMTKFLLDIKVPIV